MNNDFLKYYCLLAGLLSSNFLILAQAYDIKNGVNIQASYYNNGNVSIGWDLMKTYPEIEAVRIEIEPDRASQATRWIREAQQHNYQVIATYHKSTQLGSNQVTQLQAAANWWVQHYSQFTTHGSIIINIMNEWGGHELLPTEYANAYNDAITTIRKVYDGIIIIDVPGFGHDIEIAATAYPMIQDEQIFFSLHIYPNSINVQQDNWLTIKDLDYLVSTGAPCIIGEFGARGNGGTDWCRIVEYARSHGWAILGWAWNGDGLGMNMVSPSWLDQPRATAFEPTPYLEEMVASLAGVPCFTQNFDSGFNLFCKIGSPCNDNNDFTIGDNFNEFCVCTGKFTSALKPSVDQRVFLYPNPVKQNLTVEFFKLTQVTDLEIYSTLGQQVFVTTIPKETNAMDLNVETYPNGTYFVVVNQGKGKKIIGKFVIVAP